jgi:predicted RNA-binding Zn-ribbon protein involved in translation (DUF1610 family)
VDAPRKPRGTTRGRKRKRRKPRRRQRLLRRILVDWWVEILVAFLVVLAIFLLVEQMNIRQTLFAWLMGLLTGLRDLVDRLVQGLAALVRNTTLSDLTAYVLLVAVLVLVVWRTRQRLRTEPRFTDPKCPHCGSDLHRIRRCVRDRALNLFVPVRRYRCTNHECSWHGLRVRRSRRE